MSNLSVLFESCKTPNERQAAVDKIKGLIKSKKLDIAKISIRDVAESVLGQADFSKMMAVNADSGYVGVREAVSPVYLGNFQDITGNMVFEGAVAAFESPEFIGGLLTTPESSRRDGGRDIGFAQIDDDALIVEEGGEFPDVKYGQDYIDIPTSKKRGLKIGITREMIFFDETGKVIEQATTVGDRLGVNKEKRTLRTVLGIDNGFSRNGTARNTYVAAADPRINSLGATPLVDWNTMDAAMQVFNNMNDDRTVGEPINVMPDTMLVTQAGLWNANRILNATSIRQDTSANAAHAYGPNPVQGVKNVITSPWIVNLLVASGLSLADAKKYWFFGQPKKAFKYRTLFPFQVLAAQHDKDKFERDVVAQFRADERGVPRIVAPWYMARFFDT